MKEENNLLKKTSFFLILLSNNYDKSQLIQQLDHWGYLFISCGVLSLSKHRHSFWGRMG